MTHTFHPGDPTWSGEVGLKNIINMDIPGENGFHVLQYRLEMIQNIGTHVDSPSHFVDGGIRAHELDLANMLNIPLCVIDIRHHVLKDIGYAV